MLTQEARIKELETIKAKLQGTMQSTAVQLDKQKQSAESFKHKCLGFEGQLAAVRKVS